MPSNPRYTVKLPKALDALVQARVRAGTPFAVLIREALEAYLADTAPASADRADTLRDVQAQLTALTQRVAALERTPTPCRQSADRAVDRAPTRLPVGQFKLTTRQIASLRAKRARGVPIKALMAEFDISKATLFRYLQ